MYHYVYRITNTKENIHYYGVRSSKVHPKKDLGVKYFSSSTDEEFIKDQKENKHTSKYKYKVIKMFTNRISANIMEVYLHKKYNVSINEKFYNKNNSGHIKPNTLGMVTVLDKRDNKTKSVTMKDFNKYEYYVGVSTNKVNVLDTRDNKTKSVSKEDYNKNDYYVGSTTGYVTVLDTRDNKTKQVSKEDYDKYDYYVGSTTGMTPAIDKDGNKYYVSKDDRRIKSGELFHPSKLLKTINNGETSKRVAPELVDKYLENGWVLGTLVTKPNFSIGTKFMNKDGKRKRVHLDKIEEAKLDGWELGLPKFICPYCNKKGAGSSMHLYHFENCKEKV